MGPRVAAFERAFAERLGIPHVLAVSSCTAALHLIYQEAGIGPGDEVIVPSYTFVATAAAVRYCGATPVFADILGPHDFSIDPADVAAKISPRTKAVTAVHFAGYAAPVDELRALCDERGVILFEDAAHAPAATLNDIPLGTFGRASAFSLFSNKVLSVGEGGMVATADAGIAERIGILRSQAMTSGTWDRHTGRTDTYDVRDLGYNYRLDEARAALAITRLQRLDADVLRRQVLTHRYRGALPGRRRCRAPVHRRVGRHLDVLRDADPRAGRAAGRPARGSARESRCPDEPLLPPTHRFTAYRQYGAHLPRTESASDREVTIPLYPHMTDDDQIRVVTGIATELAA